MKRPEGGVLSYLYETRLGMFRILCLFPVLMLLACFNLAAAQKEVIIYDNTGFNSFEFLPNGGAANQGGNTITRLVADDITPLPGYSGQTISNIYFSVVNNNSTSVSARPLLRFWNADGTGGGPGTFITGLTLDPISFPSGASYWYVSPSAPMAVPAGEFWAGMTFDNNNNTTGATAAELDNLGMALYDPPSVGSSADTAFETTGAGSFLGNNPAGSTSNFGGFPVANFYFAFSVLQTVTNSPPVASSESVMVAQNGSVAITLSATDPDGDPLTYSIVNSPTHGTLSGTGANVTYRPNAGFTGSDVFTFKANDGQLDSAPAPVSISVVTTAGLVINPIFDASITGDPNASTIINTINSAILTYETRFSSPVTVSILFAGMNSGLGQSLTYINTIGYSSFFPALTASAKTANDAVALAHLTGGPNNPVNGGADITLTLANLRALGFNATPPTNYDSAISVNLSECNLDRVNIDPAKYDLMAVVSHEIDEVLGTSSGVGGANIHPPDLFRYSSTVGVRNFTTAGDDAYFSLDGATLLARYNQDPGGDYGDWWSTGSHTPQVQDAFGTPGATPNLGVELTVLDVIGWDLVTGQPSPRFQSITRANGTTELTWSAVAGRTYQLQYSATLAAGSWINLGNPVTATATTASFADSSATANRRFYQVALLPALAGQAHVTDFSQIPLPPPTLSTNYFLAPSASTTGGAAKKWE